MGVDAACVGTRRVVRLRKIKECWFKDTNKVDTTKDCWFKNTSKSGPYNNKDKKGKGKGKGKGKNSVKVTTPKELKELKEPKKMKESTVTPTGGQISRITQDDDTWDHIQNPGEENAAGYISATIQYRKPPHQSEDWYAVRILVDNCAVEHVCSPQDLKID